MNIKVSIIVPIYNVEKYLRKCLESIRKQTYKNIEIILINDGSTDNSENICKTYLDDKRFKLINQENKGLSEARNTGIKNFKGDYLLFVDSDDWLEENCIESCIKEIRKNNSDIVLFPYVKEKGTIQEKVKLFETDRIFYKQDIENIVLRRLFGLVGEELKNPLKLENLNTAWGKLYKREVIKDKFIDTKIIGTEDCIFNIYTIKNCKKISYIEKTYYHYRKTNFSSLTRLYKSDLFFKWSNLYYLMKTFIKENNLNKLYEEALNNRIILNLFSLSLNIVESNLENKKKYDELKKLLSEKIYDEKFKDFPFSKLSLSWRIFYLLCKKKWIILLMAYMIIGIKLKEKK
ncbi:glycosyltransferase family 2 protein [Fusobacterium sp.]|uniref:glycosyltransferase family 2 protein n=1 Tax=Fusobacterium sp. TaxID=68766 RepID=UPI00262A10E9|nr:glycosyltransferase family 2 protein [Fusobacterium sp.]